MAFLDTGSNRSDPLVLACTHLQVVVCQTDLLVRSKRLGHVYNFQDNFDCFRDSRAKGQFPGQSRKFRDGWQVCLGL